MSVLNRPTDPIQLALENCEYPEVLKAMAELSADDLIALAAKTEDEKIPALATYVVTKCNSVGVQQVLIFGGLLDLFAAMTEPRGNSELMRNMEEDLGVSRSQAFRCRAAWRSFGAKLLTEKQTLDQFCRESLKMLAEERTPDAAREEALRLARQGERITIKVAKRLQEKHGMDVEITDSTPRVFSDKPAHWLFSGAVVQIKLVHRNTQEQADVSEVIRDLEAAIVELRRLNESVTAA